MNIPEQMLYKAKRKDWQVFPREKQWVEGFLFPQNYNGTFLWCIGKEPLNATLNTTDYGDIYGKYRDWFAIDKETISSFTGMTDTKGNRIYKNDIVEFFGQRGVITFECGSFGIAFLDMIDWDEIANNIEPVTGCDNRLCACENDNFISLWEIAWNFNEIENNIGVIKVIGNVFDNPELLQENKMDIEREEYE